MSGEPGLQPPPPSEDGPDDGLEQERTRRRGLRSFSDDSLPWQTVLAAFSAVGALAAAALSSSAEGLRFAIAVGVLLLAALLAARLAARGSLLRAVLVWLLLVGASLLASISLWFALSGALGAG